MDLEADDHATNSQNAKGTLALAFGSIGGFAIGASLGIVTEAGRFGLIAIVGGVAGAALGLYIVQLILIGHEE